MTSQSLASQRNKDYKLRHAHLLRRVCPLSLSRSLFLSATHHNRMCFASSHTYAYRRKYACTHARTHAYILSRSLSPTHFHFHSLSRSLFRSFYSRLSSPCRADDYSQTLGPEYFCIIFVSVRYTYINVPLILVIPGFGH